MHANGARRSWSAATRRRKPGYFYPLTVIANATDAMRVVKEEQFGPVIPIVKYKTVEEAIARANSLEVGLGGSVWGNDPQEAAGYASQLECGTAWVNQHGTLHPHGAVRRRKVLRHRHRIQCRRPEGIHDRASRQRRALSHECIGHHCSPPAEPSTGGG